MLSMDVETKAFYAKAWFMWLMLFMVFPVGLFLLWYYKHHSMVLRSIITFIWISAMMTSVFASVINSDSQSGNDKATIKSNIAQQANKTVIEKAATGKNDKNNDSPQTNNIDGKLVFSSGAKKHAIVGELRAFQDSKRMDEYYPITKRSILRRKEDMNDMTREYVNEFSGEQIVDGHKVFVVSSVGYDNNGARKSMYSFYSVTDSGNIVLSGEQSFSGKITWKTAPELTYPGFIKMGQEYKIKSSSTYEQVLIAKGLVDIEISGRKFRDCLVVDRSIVVGPFSATNTNVTYFYFLDYFAKDIGLVYTEMRHIYKKDDGKKVYDGSLYYVNSK